MNIAILAQKKLSARTHTHKKGIVSLDVLFSYLNNLKSFLKLFISLNGR